jgi:hypothetical protein
MLINRDCKIVRETPENILLHTKLENRALTIRHLSLELSTNMANLTGQNLKLSDEYICHLHKCVVLPSYVNLG